METFEKIAKRMAEIDKEITEAKKELAEIIKKIKAEVRPSIAIYNKSGYKFQINDYEVSITPSGALAVELTNLSYGDGRYLHEENLQNKDAEKIEKDLREIIEKELKFNRPIEVSIDPKYCGK